MFHSVASSQHVLQAAEEVCLCETKLCILHIFRKLAAHPSFQNDRTSRKLLMCSTCGNMWYLGTRESPWDSPRRQRESSHKDCPKQELRRGGGGGGCYGSATATGVDEWRETKGGLPPPCAPKVQTRGLEVFFFLVYGRQLCAKSDLMKSCV